MGENITLPDFYLFVVAFWLRALEIDIKDFPSIAKFYQNMKTRASVQKAFAEEGFVH